MWLCGPSMHQSTVGVVGLGRIGQAVVRRLMPFGVNRLLYVGRRKVDTDLPAENVPLDALLEHSDFVMVCCALPLKTQGIFNRRLSQKWRKVLCLSMWVDDFVLIRKTCMTLWYLARDLLQGWTWRLLSHCLLMLKICVILPHIGSATSPARAAMTKLSVNNILAGLAGTPMPAQLKLWQCSVIECMFLITSSSPDIKKQGKNINIGLYTYILL